MTTRLWAILAIVGVVALGAGVGIGAAVWAGGDHGDDAAAASDASGHGGTMMDDADGSDVSEQAFLATRGLELGHVHVVVQTLGARHELTATMARAAVVAAATGWSRVDQGGNREDAPAGAEQPEHGAGQQAEGKGEQHLAHRRCVPVTTLR